MCAQSWVSFVASVEPCLSPSLTEFKCKHVLYSSLRPLQCPPFPFGSLLLAAPVVPGIVSDPGAKGLAQQRLPTFREPVIQ